MHDGKDIIWSSHRPVTYMAHLGELDKGGYPNQLVLFFKYNVQYPIKADNEDLLDLWR